ncbi:MAG: FMN-binding protein [Candidatus Marinimicrobia bacterium]|nr:FMN-binding protein [Candidatus Neomarinimicrobiota bacterium]
MKSAKLIIVLTVTTLLSGIGLSFLNSWAQPKIEAYQQKVLEQAIYDVLPGIEKYKVKEIEGTKFYEGISPEGQTVNVAFRAIGRGFQSELRILVGMDTSMTKILNVNLLQQAETPGLGTKIADDPGADNPAWFMQQFDSLTVAQQDIDYVKNEEPDKENAEIEAITGATISSKSVVNIINKAIDNNRELYNSGQ